MTYTQGQWVLLSKQGKVWILFTRSSVHRQEKFMDMVNLFWQWWHDMWSRHECASLLFQYLKRQHEGSRLPTKTAKKSYSCDLYFLNETVFTR